MFRKIFLTSMVPIVCIFVVTSACSLPPMTPVTRDELMQTGLYRNYIINESPEQLLNALNADGDVVFEAKRNIRGTDYPVHIKILATPEGLEIVDYDIN